MHRSLASSNCGNKPVVVFLNSDFDHRPNWDCKSPSATPFSSSKFQKFHRKGLLRVQGGRFAAGTAVRNRDVVTLQCWPGPAISSPKNQAGDQIREKAPRALFSEKKRQVKARKFAKFTKMAKIRRRCLLITNW